MWGSIDVVLRLSGRGLLEDIIRVFWFGSCANCGYDYRILRVRFRI